MNSARSAAGERLRSGRNQATTAMAAIRQSRNANGRPGRPVSGSSNTILERSDMSGFTSSSG